MGEARRKRHQVFSTPEQVQAAIRDKADGYTAIHVGAEGFLTDAHLARVAENVRTFHRVLPPCQQFLFVFSGFVGETRPPDQIPEVAGFVASLASRLEGIPPSRFVGDTQLLLLRCGAVAFVKPGGTVIRLNDKGPIVWRLSDVPGTNGTEPIPAEAEPLAAPKGTAQPRITLPDVATHDDETHCRLVNYLIDRLNEMMDRGFDSDFVSSAATAAAAKFYLFSYTSGRMSSLSPSERAAAGGHFMARIDEAVRG